jgi:pimeloyl-ACP methyl ester carboxylesterase
MKNFLCTLACIASALLPACTQNQKEMETTTSATSTKSKNFVFIHGSFHGAWCWYKMLPLLNKNGNTALAIDLPGNGRDGNAPGAITLEHYVEAVGRVLEQSKDPVVLIGHSRAGIVLSQVAERWPEKIDQLVYLCAFLIPNGEPMVATALTDTTSVLVSSLIFNEAEGWHIPKASAYREAFYHDCSEEDITLCSALLSKEPVAPVGTPLQLSAERFGKVKKNYVFTTEDKAVTYSLQKKMVERLPVDRTFELKTSHSPFLSQPGELADILLKL